MPKLSINRDYRKKSLDSSYLLYKSSLKAETDGLLADQADSAFETTTGMRKQADRPDSEYLLDCGSCKATEQSVDLYSWCCPACRA